MGKIKQMKKKVIKGNLKIIGIIRMRNFKEINLILRKNVGNAALRGTSDRNVRLWRKTRVSRALGAGSTDTVDYKGNIDGETCLFKIDTGSDVSVVNEKLIRGPKRCYVMENCYLKYPTGETIPVKYKVIVEIELGKYSLDIPMLVASISDDCILGAGFLEKVKLEKIFESEFGSSGIESDNEISCSRMMREGMPYFLQMFFEENSKNLTSSEKDIFADFLIEFWDVFSENLITGNCEVLRPSINVKDFKPIKQAPGEFHCILRKRWNTLLRT